MGGLGKGGGEGGAWVGEKGGGGWEGCGIIWWIWYAAGLGLDGWMDGWMVENALTYRKGLRCGGGRIGVVRWIGRRESMLETLISYPRLLTPPTASGARPTTCCPKHKSKILTWSWVNIFLTYSTSLSTHSTWL